MLSFQVYFRLDWATLTGANLKAYEVFMTMLRVKHNRLEFNGKVFECAYGKNGFTRERKEGGGQSPVGVFPLRECWYRADVMDEPKTGLPVKVILREDGWCDDARSQNYNRHVKLVRFDGDFRGVDKDGFGAEKLHRPDGSYDLIVPIGYNDDPVVPGQGSAIFLHVAKPDYSGTEGCIALAKQDLLAILPHLDANTKIEITE